jgi:hypothetical protein
VFGDLVGTQYEPGALIYLLLELTSLENVSRIFDYLLQCLWYRTIRSANAVCSAANLVTLLRMADRIWCMKRLVNRLACQASFFRVFC